MDKKEQEQLNIKLTELAFQARELAAVTSGLPQSGHTATDAWRLVYRAQEALRVLVTGHQQVAQMVLTVQCRRLDTPHLRLTAVHDLTVLVLRKYLGLTSGVYPALYAALANPEWNENSPEAQALTATISEELTRIESWSDTRDKTFVLETLQLALAALTLYGRHTEVTRREFISALHASLRHIERPDVALEIFCTIGT